MRLKSKTSKVVHAGQPSTFYNGWATINCVSRSFAPGKWVEVTEGVTCKSCIKKAS